MISEVEIKFLFCVDEFLRFNFIYEKKLYKHKSRGRIVRAVIRTSFPLGCHTQDAKLLSAE